MGRGGARSGAGRPKRDDSKTFKTLGLTPAQWEWLSRFNPSGSPSQQLAEFVERGMKMWPKLRVADTDKIDASNWKQSRFQA